MCDFDNKVMSRGKSELNTRENSSLNKCQIAHYKKKFHFTPIDNNNNEMNPSRLYHIHVYIFFFSLALYPMARLLWKYSRSKFFHLFAIFFSFFKFLITKAIIIASARRKLLLNLLWRLLCKNAIRVFQTDIADNYKWHK